MSPHIDTIPNRVLAILEAAPQPLTLRGIRVQFKVYHMSRAVPSALRLLLDRGRVVVAGDEHGAPTYRATPGSQARGVGPGGGSAPLVL